MPRKYERVTYLTEVLLKSASGKRDARISDLSAGGCFVDTIVTVREGEPISLSGKLEDGQQWEFEGKVAYVMDGFGFGVTFDEMSETSRAVLDKILARSN